MTLTKAYLGLSLLGGILLSSSIGLNILLYQRATQYYRELNQTRLDPWGLSDRPEDSQSPRPQSQTQPKAHTRRVVFFGDSRARSWVKPTLQGYEFINAGVSSQTSVQALYRLPLQLPPIKPDVVVIQVGINDLKTIALFPQRKAEIIRRCKANLQQMVQDIQRLGALTIVTTIFPTGDISPLRQPFWSTDIERAIQDLNAFIAHLGEPLGDLATSQNLQNSQDPEKQTHATHPPLQKVFVFDTFSLLADDRGKVLRSYQEDELHLTPQGYTVLNEALTQKLLTLQVQGLL